MKKVFSFILICLILFSLVSCSGKSVQYSFQGKKPNQYYYTDSLVKCMKKCGTFKVSVLETNLNKEINLKQEDINTLSGFFNSIRTKNFLTTLPELPQKPAYRFYISTNIDKYVINVYNEKYVSIFPWDGSYNMDYIDMSDVKTLYNLYNLCKYLYKS